MVDVDQLQTCSVRYPFGDVTFWDVLDAEGYHFREGHEAVALVAIVAIVALAALVICDVCFALKVVCSF